MMMMDESMSSDAFFHLPHVLMRHAEVDLLVAVHIGRLTVVARRGRVAPTHNAQHRGDAE